jgi:SnoaL-like domain
MDAARLRTFGTKYTAAWCSQEAAAVAAFYAENGSLKINEGTPSAGRTAITAAAQGFMTDFPDMVVVMDDVSLQGDHAVYPRTLTGTNTGPGGTGRAVRISGYEEWTFGRDGLIAESSRRVDRFRGRPPGSLSGADRSTLGDKGGVILGRETFAGFGAGRRAE